MTTARELITRSMRLVEIIGQDETPEASELNDALLTFNEMLSFWSAEYAPVFLETKESFSLTSNDGEYTIGSGADFNTVRPLRILHAFVRDGSNDYPLEIIDQAEYAAIGDKTEQGSYPDFLYYDANYPTGKIFLWPLPGAGYTLHLYSEKPLTEPATLDDVLVLPPGHSMAYRFNLAVILAPEWGKEPPRTVENIARKTKLAIENANRENDFYRVRSDDALLVNNNGAYDVYRGV